MSTKSADSGLRDDSPEHDGVAENRTSKKRKVLSCYACRNRKMKCDRVYPVCGRCQKNGRAGLCEYDSRVLNDVQSHDNRTLTAGATNSAFTLYDGGMNEASVNDITSSPLYAKIRAQERRISTLEKRLAATTANKNLSHYTAIPALDFIVPEEIMFRGKGFKTQFHGSTSVMSMISQVK